MSYFDDRTGLVMARLSTSRRLVTGVTILLAGVAIQLGNLI
jgi:hypothetical protein